jgi:predicted Zn-dependent protease
LFYNFLNSKTQKGNNINDADNSFSVLNELEQEQTQGNGDSLIDKFLMESPGAIRLNSSTGNQLENVTRIDVLEKSTTENDEIITETLADIYLQQKKYEKALKAYAKLSLKYPEKSVYFATRIKEIEDLKNIN